MSVEHKTIIIAGMTEETFYEHFGYPKDEILEDFVDDFCIESDSWCNGQKFFAQYITSIDEGCWCSIDEILSSYQRLIAIDKFRKGMLEFGFDIPEQYIQIFIVSQVF